MSVWFTLLAGRLWDNCGMETEKIKNLIESRLSNSTVMVDGDGRHFDAVVVCEQFAGKSRVQQHQLVYGVVKEEMANDSIHALSLKTYTPEGWEEANR